VDLQPGQALSTGAGKAEILLTPGVFLRVGDHSTIKMVSASLTKTEADLVKGQATVEVAELHTYNLFRIGENGANPELLRDSLYAFDADNDRVRVLKGEARVEDNDQNVVVKSGHELDLSSGGKLKSTKFDKNAYEATDPYRFSDLRSELLGRGQCGYGSTILRRWSRLVWSRLVLGPVVLVLHLAARQRHFLQPIWMGILLAMDGWLCAVLRPSRLRILRTLLCRTKPSASCGRGQRGTRFRGRARRQAARPGGPGLPWW